MKIKEVVTTLERFAPLPLQDSYDNAGLQVGLTEAEASGVLLCLDVTEDVIEEAHNLGLNLIVSHHPLLFKSIKQVCDRTYVERCVRLAIRYDITLYAAHTNLDNAPYGVNHAMARKLKLTDTMFLDPHANGGGSGMIGTLPAPVSATEFIQVVIREFGLSCLQHNALLTRPVSRVAVCGGAGDFLLDMALEQGADAFLTGEMHYHRYFGHDDEIQIGVMGHYESEIHTVTLLQQLLQEQCPGLRVETTRINTNPIHYTCNTSTYHKS